MQLPFVPETIDDVSDHGALIVFFAFGMTLMAWAAYRLLSKDGIIPNFTNNIQSCNEQNSQTLIRFEKHAEAQQGLCGRHADGLDFIGQQTKELVELHKSSDSPFATGKTNEMLGDLHGKLDEHKEQTAGVSEEWGHVNANEFRAKPILDAMLKAIDAAEHLLAKCDCDVSSEIATLRSDVAAIRDRIHLGE